MRIVEIGANPDYLQLVDELKHNPPVLLVGSFISVWRPSCLSNGQKLTNDIYDLLFPHRITALDREVDRYLRSIFLKVPFEHIFERCPNESTIRHIIRKIFSIAIENPIHRAIASGVESGSLRAILTTNYDLCLDSALGCLGNPGNPSVKRVIRESELETVDRLGAAIYFKIHGSVDDRNGESLVFALRHESILPAWKRSLLVRILSQQSLLVIGYSGLDFEICPELSQIPIRRIYWNNLTRAFPSPNAEALLTKTSENMLIAGDMRQLISDLISPASADMCSPVDSFVTEIGEHLNEQELNEWRVTLLNSIGCPTIAVSLAKQSSIEKLSPADRIRMQRQSAQALFHQGRYRDAAKTFLLAAHDAARLQNHVLKAELLLDACDAFRCYGAFFCAFRSLKSSDAAVNLLLDDSAEKTRLLGKRFLKHVLLLRHFYQIARHIGKLRTMILEKCKNDLRIASRCAIETGNWLDFQQVRWWAERLNIDPTVLAEAEHYEPPPVKSGYDHLGYHVAQSGVFRDKLQKSAGSLSAADGIQLEMHIQRCKRFGNHPEIWKLTLLKLKLARGRKLRDFTQFVRHFLKCQYKPMLRLQQLLTGG